MARTSPKFYHQSLLGFFTFTLIWAAGSACSSAKKSAEAGVAPSTPVPDEVSLRADRSDLESLRKDVPEDLKKENDELALILQTMASGDDEPSKVRERFNKAVRTRRTTQDRDMRQMRDEYSREEKRSREAFLKKLQAERNSFSKKKSTNDERQRFFSDQDSKRRNYFAALAEKRSAFESKMTERRTAFEDHVREKTNQFNQAHREYSTAFYERRKAEALKRRTEDKAKQNAKAGGGSPAAVPAGAEGSNPYQEWQEVPKGPATKLGVPSEGP